MRPCFLLSAILFCGCVDTSHTNPVKPAQKQSKTSDSFAADYFIEYATLAADAAAETAKKCEAEEFRDITEADDFFNQQTKLARMKANESFSSAITKSLDDKKGKKASEAAATYRKVEAGFRSIRK